MREVRELPEDEAARRGHMSSGVEDNPLSLVGEGEIKMISSSLNPSLQGREK